MGARQKIDLTGLAGRISVLPGFAAVREAVAAAGAPVYLVGGAVRDALLGLERADLDLVVEGDQLELARALGGELRPHDRFATASVRRDGVEIDVARARAETYAHPGALPEVRPAELQVDLARRDFSINAVAVAVADPGRPIDPQGGIEDLRAGRLRALHGRSLADDPTRGLRAARYVARLGLEVEAATMAQIRAADLRTVSADRVAAELRRIAEERAPRDAVELLDRWGLFAVAPGAAELAGAVAELVGHEPWAATMSRPEAVLAALDPATVANSRELLESPPSPSAGVELARGRPLGELALARAQGAEWLDTYLTQWSRVELEIGGADLLAAGVPEGEAVGRGLAAAMEAKLDGRVSGRERELALALEAARASV